MSTLLEAESTSSTLKAELKPRPKVYIHRMGSWYHLYMDKQSEAALASFADVVSDGPREEPLSAAELVERIRGCSAILSLGGGGSHEITAAVLKEAGTVQVICIAHWCEQMLEAGKAAGIRVTEGSNANTMAVVEWTVTAALMGVRRLHVLDRQMKAGSPWCEEGSRSNSAATCASTTPLARRDSGLLCESTVGLIGLGRIGSYCAQTLRALGAKVIAYDPYWTPERAAAIGVTLVSRDEVMATSDVISLHLPVTSETRGMLGAVDFALIKDGAVFINSARAALYDEAALVAELQKQRFTAFLDVFSTEPLPPDHPIRSLPNVVITPHCAGDNHAMFLRCGREAIQTLRAWSEGEGLRNLQYTGALAGV